MTVEALPVSLELPADLLALRERALALHRGPQHGIPELTLADAEAWAAHAEDEPWLVWRARRCAARLAAMPFDLEPGERLAGKPRFRPPTPEEQPALDRARAVLATVPPHPGGDTGHFHPDWPTLLRLGIDGLCAQVAEYASQPGLDDEAIACYHACAMVLGALAGFCYRAGDACEAMAAEQPAEADAWRERAATCRRVATAPPATFTEALQLVWLTTVALWFGEDHYLTCPGRMDQVYGALYAADLAAGRLTPQGALELLACLYIHYNRILWPGSAVAVLVGGVDADGRDVTGELTWLCLAARLATRLVYPTVAIAWHPGTPDALMDFAMEMLATGIGDPALFNDPLIAAGLREHGVSEADCHDYHNSTCVEIKVCGASNMWVTAPYFNLPRALLDEVAAAVGGAAPPTFQALQDGVRARLERTIADTAKALDAQWWQRGRTGGCPLASCLIADCLARGRDFDRGGARYNWVENSFVGLANLVDGLLAVKHLVYDRAELSLAQLHEILGADWQGHEALRRRIETTLPKYGNDDPAADSLAAAWAQFLIDVTEAQTVGPHRYVPGFFCWIMHERMGAETGATPDGRAAGWPLADGAGAAQGREQGGPTASILSTTGWSHQPVLGGLVHNIKFSDSLLRSSADRRSLRRLIETYLQRGGFELQVNVVGRETLLDARAHPERYPDLLVRVAGYSDYFVHLNDAMQQEVIARTEHAL